MPENPAQSGPAPYRSVRSWLRLHGADQCAVEALLRSLLVVVLDELADGVSEPIDRQRDDVATYDQPS